MNEEGKMGQRTGHRRTTEASYPRLGHDEIPAEQDHGSAGIGSLHLCEREKVNNNRDGSEAGKSAELRT